MIVILSRSFNDYQYPRGKFISMSWRQTDTHIRWIDSEYSLGTGMLLAVMGNILYSFRFTGKYFIAEDFMRGRAVWPATIGFGFGRYKRPRRSIKETSWMTVISNYTGSNDNWGRWGSSAISYSWSYAIRTKRDVVGGAVVDLMQVNYHSTQCQQMPRSGSRSEEPKVVPVVGLKRPSNIQQRREKKKRTGRPGFQAPQ